MAEFSFRVPHTEQDVSNVERQFFIKYKSLITIIQDYSDSDIVLTNAGNNCSKVKKKVAYQGGNIVTVRLCNYVLLLMRHIKCINCKFYRFYTS